MSVIVVSVAIGLLLFAINVAKGKPVFAIFGLLGGVLGIIGAVRLAKPDSWWARRYYDDEQLRLAARRFPENAEHLQWPCPECGETFTGGRALARHRELAHGVSHEVASTGSSGECPVCGVLFETKEALAAHVARFHPDHATV